MKLEEIELIKSKHNAAIIAPAGHGKTEMITDLVDKLPGKKLVLTHTNAGVDALSQRLKGKLISNEKFCFSTISAFCMKWCNAYPETAEIDLAITVMDGRYYPMIHAGAVRIFSHKWARKIITRSFTYIIVDEYQDCTLDQHQIFVEMNKEVPVYVLGDPLQAIFGFSGNLVSWKRLPFEILQREIETYPWRWVTTNPALGLYLSSIRNDLLPSLDGHEVTLSIKPVPDIIFHLSPSDMHGQLYYDILSKYETVLYISKWPSDTVKFAQSTGGQFQNDEKQNLDILYDYAIRLEPNDGCSRANVLFDFINECAIGISAELEAYKRRILGHSIDFHLIKKHPEFGRRLSNVYQYHQYNDMLSLLEWIRTSGVFKLYRRELFFEMQRTIRRARDLEIPLFQAAREIRMTPGNQSKYSNYKRLSSRTLLSKGLEFDCVIIDLSKADADNYRYSATDMYVAMTRAKYAIYFITNQDSILLSAPLGVT